MTKKQGSVGEKIMTYVRKQNLEATGEFSSRNLDTYLGYCDVDFNNDKVPASSRSFDAWNGAPDNKTRGLVHDMGWGRRIRRSGGEGVASGKVM